MYETISKIIRFKDLTGKLHSYFATYRRVDGIYKMFEEDYKRIQEIAKGKK